MCNILSKGTERGTLETAVAWFDVRAGQLHLFLEKFT